MIQKIFSLIIVGFLFLGVNASAQMWNGQDTLYGNEWINYDQEYYKIKVAEDGIYRLTGQQLEDAGVPISQIKGSEIQVFSFGKEIPIYTTSDGVFLDSDYLEFFGEKNRSGIDTFLFDNWREELINEGYSLFNDTAAYFLTWETAAIGKRFADGVNDISNPPAREEYYWETEVVRNTSFLLSENFGYNHYSHYQNEGFSSRLLKTQSLSLEPTEVYDNGMKSELSIEVSYQNLDHHQRIHLNSNLLWEDSIPAGSFLINRLSFEVPYSDISDGMTLDFEGTLANTDKQSVSKVELKYPRSFKFDGEKAVQFNLKGTDDKYLEIEGTSINSTPILYDLTTSQRIELTYENSLIRAGLKATNNQRKLFIFDDDEGTISPTIESVDFKAIEEGDFVIISHPLLMQGASNWIEEYNSYRNSVEGGNSNSVVVSIEELYNQFAYGIERHPLSIRNFIFFGKKRWQNLKNVLLVGKGIEYQLARTDQQFQTAVDQGPFLIPTFGFPGADNKFCTSNTSDSLEMNIGRLAARSPEQVKIYLDKLKQYESNYSLPQTIEDRLWMKRIVHLGGGNKNETTLIQALLNRFEEEIETNQFGGNVESFFKTSEDPIQNSKSQRLTELVNTGVSLMTYFGHSYLGGFAFGLDSPDAFDNTDKYPVMLSYGCFSGQLHSLQESIGEEFIFHENGGAIGFVASTGVGSITALNSFGKTLYDTLGGGSYAKGIAELHLETVNRWNRLLDPLPQQSTLHGDPLLRINPHPGTDLIIDHKSIKFYPEQINVNEDSFSIELDLANIGTYQQGDSADIAITRELPDGRSFELLRQKVAVPAYVDKHKFTFSLAGTDNTELGFNNFSFEVDPDNQVQELPASAEQNNIVVFDDGSRSASILFFSNDVLPIYPEIFSIHSETDLELIATNYNVFSPNQDYFFEIDTVPTFSSSFLRKQKISEKGSVIKWNPGIVPTDNEVYYWRVRPDSTLTNGSFSWQSSSFVFQAANNKKGWNQSHIGQYQEDRFNNLMVENGEIEFVDDFKDVLVRNRTLGQYENNLFVNTEYTWRAVWNQRVDVILFDSLTGNIIYNMPGDSIGSGALAVNRALPAFQYVMNREADRLALINFLENLVPSGAYVVIMTGQRQGASGSYSPELWAADSTIASKNLFNVFESQGASLIRQTETIGSFPYILVYQKDVGLIGERLADDLAQIVTLQFSIAGSWYEGDLETVPIGPSNGWNSLEWNVINDTTDRFSLDLIGIDSVGEERVLIDSLGARDTSLSWIDHLEYPFLKLRINVYDSLLRTPPKIEYLRVLYEGVPELALNISEDFSFYSDTLFQGDSLGLTIAVENLSDWKVDSFQTDFSVVNDQNEIVSMLMTSNSLPERGKEILKIQESTSNLEGAYRLQVNTNSKRSPVEKVFENNFGQLNFFVNKDETNPILDVTFDGTHITNGDIVSPQPLIRIELRDENIYFPLTDTSSFQLYLKSPSTSQEERISLSSNVVKFFPADPSDSDNKASLEFTPTLLEDGTYQLRVVAKDRSNNHVGETDYIVSFEVINESAISDFINYPNPFSNATRFLYTLTGMEEPAQFKIQIFSVSGKIVKEITKEEFGELKMGRHLSDYVWDGTDDFGDKLANGVYLYRVVAKDINGEILEEYDLPTQALTQSEFGKMVILR